MILALNDLAVEEGPRLIQPKLLTLSRNTKNISQTDFFIPWAQSLGEQK